MNSLGNCALPQTSQYSFVQTLFARSALYVMCDKLACFRLSGSGEDAKVKGTRKVGGAKKRKSFLSFYFRLRAFLIQRPRLSRNLEQASDKQDVGRKWLGNF